MSETTQPVQFRTTTITRKYSLEAAHFLPNVPDGHKCKRLHGHNWGVNVTVIGRPSSDSGWLLDFFELDDIWSVLHGELDHRCLNDIVENPTSETLCAYLRDRIAEMLPSGVLLKQVRISENANSVAQWDLFDDMLFDAHIVPQFPEGFFERCDEQGNTL